MSKETIVREASEVLAAMGAHSSDPYSMVLATVMQAQTIDRLTELLRPLVARVLEEIAKDDRLQANGK